MLPPFRGQCRGYFSGSVLANPFFKASGRETVEFADLKGERQRLDVVAHPFDGSAKAVGDLVGIQKEIGFRMRGLLLGGLVLEGQHADVQGALEGGDERKQGHDVVRFIERHVGEEPLELLAWCHGFGPTCGVPDR